jgi:acyl-CoA thioesterase FadM
VTRMRLYLRRTDMDLLGHLNHAVYHELFHEVRAALIEPLRTTEERYVLASDAVDFLREVRYEHGYVDAVVRVEALGRTSITLHHELLLPDGTLAARNRVVLVAWSVRERSPRELSAHERAALALGHDEQRGGPPDDG